MRRSASVREHWLQLLLRNPAEVREIGHFVRDLRSRGGDEVVEEPRGDVLLLGRQLRHRAFEMLLDDVPGAPEPLQSRRPAAHPSPPHALRPRAAALRAGGRAPRCARRSSAPWTVPRPPSAGSIWPAPTSSSTALDQLRLDRDGLHRRARRSARRAARSRRARTPVEPVESERSSRRDPGSGP